jgi:hypothetical protein
MPGRGAGRAGSPLGTRGGRPSPVAAPDGVGDRCVGLAGPGFQDFRLSPPTSRKPENQET